jgi:hypothetical protein
MCSWQFSSKWHVSKGLQVIAHHGRSKSDYLKCRAGFDLTIELAWRAAMTGTSAAEASGTLSLANISPDELDELGDLMTVTVVEKDDGIGSNMEVARPVKSMADKLQEQLTKLHQLLKER